MVIFSKFQAQNRLNVYTAATPFKKMVNRKEKISIIPQLIIKNKQENHELIQASRKKGVLWVLGK